MAKPSTVTKAELSLLTGVSRQRVSQWIAEGKIGPEALEGEGPRARVRVALALKHLRERLDANQRFGLNGLWTNLTANAPESPKADAVVAAPIVDSVEARIKAEKLRQAELATRRAEEDDRARRGIYCLASEVRAAMNRQAVSFVKFFDGALPDLAEALAAKHKISAREALHTLRSEMLRIRARAAKNLRLEAAALPEFVEDEGEYDADIVPDDQEVVD
jgi:hypothetical protein